MTESTSSSSPVCFIKQQGDKLIVCPEGVELLKTLDCPLAIVAIAGLYRTGKSFLLNSLVRNRGFDVGRTTEACTRGIWLWSVEFPKQYRKRRKEGEEHTGDRNKEGGGGGDNEAEEEEEEEGDGDLPKNMRLLLMDTEGLASLDQDEAYDAKVFSLALLLCSYLVLNSMGVIDEAAIDRLFLISELTKHIAVSTTLGTEGGSNQMNQESELSVHFPPLLWLLRDFVLDLQHQGESVSRRQYLEEALRIRPGSGRRVEDRNAVRRSLINLFTRRDCMTMVRPAVEENEVREAGNLDPKKLRPEFLSQLNELREMIFGRVEPKRCFGRLMTGPMLSTLASSYVEAINHGDMPNIRGAWATVVEDSCRSAMKHALDNIYIVGMKSVWGHRPIMDISELFEEHQAWKEKAMQYYQTKSMGDIAVRIACELTGALDTNFSTSLSHALETSRALCHAALQKSYNTTIELPLSNGEWKEFDDVRKAVTTFIQHYTDEASGPCVWSVFSEAWNSHLLPALQRFDSHLQAKHTAQCRELEHTIDTLKSEVELRKGERDAQAETVSLLQGVKRDLELAVADEKQQLSATRTTLTEKQEELSRKAAEFNDAQREKDRLELKLTNLEAELLRAKEEWSTNKTLLDRRIEEKEQQLEDRSQRIGHLDIRLQQQSKDLTKANKAYSEEHTRRVRAEGERDRLDMELASLRESMAGQAQEYARLQLRLQEKNKDEEEEEEVKAIRSCLDYCLLEVERTDHYDTVKDMWQQYLKVLEEKDAIHEKLQEYLLKISALPVFYQRQIFCSPGEVDLVTALSE